MTREIFIQAAGYPKRKVNYLVHDHYIDFDIQELINEDWNSVVEGAIKWDGCSNLKYHGTIHYCGFCDAEHWLNMIRCCYCICEEEMPKWDGLDESYEWPEGYARHDT